jgi:glycosyltransferase involved in cell wall biosynthesis
MVQRKLIVMLGVHRDSKEKGGICSVVDVYRAGGLFQRWPIHYIGTVASGSHILKLRVLASALSDFLRVVFSGRLALVHAQTSSRASFWRKSIFIVIALAARRPVILQLHGSEFERFYRIECGAFRKRLVRWILNHVDRVIVLSSQYQDMIQRIASAANVVKIFNPAPMANAALTPDSSQTERTSNVVLFLGRFGARKGVFDLLQALAIIRARFPAVRLRCGGDGDIEGVRAHALQLGLADCVAVLGWVRGPAKEREIAQAAMYVLPSYAEGLPMGILEAMAGGAPVVSTTVGGIPDAIEDGSDGFLVEPGDVNALADRIMRLLRSGELRERFAATARAKVQNVFAPEKVLSQLEGLYADLGASPRIPDRSERGLKDAVGPL